MMGRMQDWSMTLDKIIDHAYENHPDREVVTRSVEGPIVRSNYKNVWVRSKKFSQALKAIGMGVGDRVATLAWNTDRHVEAWYGTMGIGAVLHTVNPRLFPEQIIWICQNAGSKVLLVDTSFLPLIEQIADRLTLVEKYIVLTSAHHMPSTPLPGAIDFETFIEDQSTDVQWGGFDENTAAGLCYTSGTTGDPKGVLYSHRSNMIHALAANQGDYFGLCAHDVVLPIVPMFHANAWALTFVAPMTGCKLVMPGAKLDGASIYELLEQEQVTFSAAVPTVWFMLLEFLRANDLKLTTLKRAVIGGSALPESMLLAFEDEYGVEVVQAWGMTEMSPIGTMGTLSPRLQAAPRETQVKTKLKQGRAPFTVSMKIVNEDGETLPREEKHVGRLLVQGPAVAKSYLHDAGARNDRGEVLEPCGYFDTGDIATIDDEGYMAITDRAKDVIKSGGEWISSIEIENIAVGAEGVACAAVIGIADPKWDERPLLVIETSQDANPTKEDLLAFLEGKIAKWWMPDDVRFVETIPLGATGKIDKRALRTMLDA